LREDNIMDIKEYIKNKRILVTGGTGSFGHQIVSELANFRPKRILVFSRDEKKQHDMAHDFEEYSRLLEFVVGDVRDYARVHEAMKNIDLVYHAAALKQVPNCEDHPFEAVKTNVIGAENVRRAAIENKVAVGVTISTDKAVKPVNVMGMTKAIQERIMLNPNSQKWGTRFICVRYGNVLGSRGSVVPYFKQRIEENKFLPVTHPRMTRFILTLEEAVDLVFEATVQGEDGELFVRKMPACCIIDLARAMAKAMTGRDDYPIEEVGIRQGEKIDEILVSEEEMLRAIEGETYFVIRPYGRIEKSALTKEIKEYTSNNTRMLNQAELISLLKKERLV
jgi:UDP-N-acetylglucosamine 4,6-dehydratase